MQIRQIVIRNFRGIEQLDWKPSSALSCLIGRGDVGKSTVLDAVELALSPRAPAITDTDFIGADPNKSIEIEVTVGELSEEALEDHRFGLHLRGWQKTGDLRDEPQDDDEAVVTVRAVIDASLEGEWMLYTDRQDPKPLQPRDRALFGVVRLGPEVEKHLNWGRNTALSAATDDRDPAGLALADAFRVAREHVVTKGVPTLAGIVAAVRDEATKLGAYCGTAYGAGLDAQRTATSLSGLALHDGAVPVRLAGLGTRRLVSLAIQRMSVKAGAIVLIDEIEHGLEPHRIRHALKVLRDALDTAPPAPKGQVFLTTHSYTTLVELSHQQLAVCCRTGGIVTIRTPGANLQSLLRRVPEAFLAQRILVCEGPTEIGLVRGLRDSWSAARSSPFEARGTWLADGAGHPQAVTTALELASLGYTTALFRDSDVPMDPGMSAQLSSASIDVYEWDGALATEQRIFTDASWSVVQRLLDIAYEAHTETSVVDQTAHYLGVKNLPGPKVSDWHASGKTDDEIRAALGTAAHKKGWYKNTTFGQLVGETLGAEIRAVPSTPLAQLLAKVEAWLYA